MNDIYNVQVGNRIKKARKQKRMSMKDLGLKVNLHESTVSRYEKGDIKALDIDKLKEFAIALDTSPSYLMGWEDEKEDNKKDTVYSDIGNNIKSLRESNNITLVEMSKELSIPIEDIKAYEKGLKEIPIEYLKMFAKYFNVSVDELISFEVDNNRTVFITKDEQLSRRYKKWQERIGYDITFTEEEIDEIINFALYLVSKRK